MSSLMLQFLVVLQTPAIGANPTHGNEKIIINLYINYELLCYTAYQEVLCYTYHHLESKGSHCIYIKL